MARFILFASAFVMATASVPFVAASPALAEANPNVEFCKDYVASGVDPELNRGECVSILNLIDKNGFSGQAYAVHWCDYLAENYPSDFDALYGGSKKDCIADNK